MRAGPSLSRSSSTWPKAQRSGELLVFIAEAAEIDGLAFEVVRSRDRVPDRPVGPARQWIDPPLRHEPCARSIVDSPTKTWGVVLGNGPITRQSRIGSNRASTLSSDRAAGPERAFDRAAEASWSRTRSRIASRADSPARRSCGLRSWIAAR
jgi:hypothetical protein